MHVLPEFLFHGCRSSALASIRQDGLLPRSMTGRDNWDHTASSHPEAVYLTTAYPLHFALSSDADGHPCILRIRTDRLDSDDIVGDEDSYALAGAAHRDLPADLGTSERAAFWRDRLDETRAEFSLQLIGNCAHLGSIPPEAIDQVLVIDAREAAMLVYAFADPVIAPANYRFLGKDYDAFSAWLFTDFPSWTSSLRHVVQAPRRIYRGPLAATATIPTDA